MKRVLVVDDKEDNVYMLSTLLAGHGFVAMSARHGAEALAMARLEPPDLIISDLLMPVMDGYTLLRHWRSDKRLGNVPFIVYTATYTEPEDEQLALDLGADAFLLKPADPDDFMRSVRTVLTDHPIHDRAALDARRTRETPETFKAYSDTLIRKLEEKSIQLEETNRILQADIEKRKETEHALRRSEAEFRVLGDAMPQIVWIATPEGEIASFNRLWTTYTGLDRDVGLMDGLAVCIHPDERDRELESWLKAVASIGTYSGEVRLRRADGEFRWWLARAVPVLDEAGQPLKWIGTFTDIHDLKVTEESLRRSQRLEVVGQLTGGIAHDFNNILQVILVNVEQMQGAQTLSPEIRASVDNIGHSVDQAGDLIRRLMAFSRQQSLRPAATDVNQLVHDTGRLLRLALGEQIELVETFAIDLGSANIDRSQLESALLNLCVNARDAMPSGGRLSIQTRNFTLGADKANDFPETAVGEYVQIIVTDTGTGIDANTLDRVFEPFFTTKEEGKGTGLGLSMVYGFVKQSRGHITIESEPGHGTKVTLFLPRVRDASEPEDNVERDVAMQGRGKILLVEDNEAVRVSIRMQLEQLGFSVTEAASGTEAMEKCAAQTSPFDLLLSDVAMPGEMDGWALSEVVGRRWPSMVRILMSGNPEEAAPDAAHRDSAVHLLAKPFRSHALARLLNDRLSAARSRVTP